MLAPSHHHIQGECPAERDGPVGVALTFRLTGALPALGQERPAAPAFSTVRLSAPAYTRVATLVGVGSDSLELGIEGLSQPIVIPIRSVDPLEFRRPASRRERAARGALWGAGPLGIMSPLLADRDEDTGLVEVALASVVAGACGERPSVS